jgi:hypothetical protein
LALVGAFAVGWGSRALAQRPAPPGPVATDHGAEPGARACVDPAAMAANANLVGQVHDAERRAAGAREAAAREAEARIVAARAETPRLATSRDEWARMAREGTIRLRLPCASWSSGGRLEVQRVSGRRTVGHAPGRWQGTRAEAAGFSSEELETLGDVYRRVHERTWEAMRPLCEGDPTYTENLALASEEPTARDRIDACRRSLLDVSTYGVAAGIASAAELRAAGAPRERARGNEERLAFALSEAPALLDEEMTRTFGREKTLRAVDNGLLCFDEAVYDLRSPRDTSDTPNN